MLTKRTVRGKTTYWLDGKQLPRWSSVGDVIYKKDLAHWYEQRMTDALYNAVCDVYSTSVAEQDSIVDFAVRVKARIEQAKKEQKEQISAAQKGTLVHERIRAELHRMRGEVPTNHVPELSDIQLLQFQCAMEWVKQVGFTPIAIEEPVYSEALGVAGTPDAVGRVKDDPRIWIIDWKTGKFYGSHNFQNCFYQLAVRETIYRETKEVVATHGAVIELPRKAGETAIVHEVEPTMALVKNVESLVDIYKALNNE